MKINKVKITAQEFWFNVMPLLTLIIIIAYLIWKR
jgi:hypothetical protein